MIYLTSIQEPIQDDEKERYFIGWKWPARKHHPDLRLTGWPRPLLPDKKMWKWFLGDIRNRGSLFRMKYFKQLDAKKDLWIPIAVSAQSKSGVRLLYDSKKENVSPAHFLKEFIEIRRKMHTFHKPSCGHRTESGRSSVPCAEKKESRNRKRPLLSAGKRIVKQKAVLVTPEKRRIFVSK